MEELSLLADKGAAIRGRQRSWELRDIPSEREARMMRRECDFLYAMVHE